jgi:carboxymethylenebutenolidase
MCDQDSLNDMVQHWSRRQFGALAVGLGAAALWAPYAQALDGGLHESDVEIHTPDGVADAYFVHPKSGTHPGVLLWTDWRGLRPAFRAMAQRLASAGYAVLVPNPFYRIRRAPVLPDSASVADEATRNTLMGLMQSLTPAVQVADAKAFVGWLDRQPAVDHHRRMGTAGYCMGGAIALRTAAEWPMRVGAAASFHGAGLVTTDDSSPHRLAEKMHAAVLIAIAANDDAREPDAKRVLADAFAAAHLTAEIEVYAGSQHGWCPPDSPVYDEALAEKAWSRLLALYASALTRPVHTNGA